jgi:excisionase family DNA binding protein
MNKLFTVAEIAHVLQLNELTIRRYLKAGQLKGFKVGRFWRIEADELERFIQGGKGDICLGGQGNGSSN